MKRESSVCGPADRAFFLPGFPGTSSGVVIKQNRGETTNNKISETFLRCELSPS